MPADAPCPRRAHRAAGFTLVEVLVALAVLAIALAAVMRTLVQGVDLNIELRDRTVALWVAENRLALHQLQRDWPSADTTNGDSDMAGRRWRWREIVSTTPEAALRRVEIEVRAEQGEAVLARLVGFLQQPAPR